MDVANDLDNIFSDQHEICSINNLGHQSDQELGNTDAEQANKECYAIVTSKREYYSLSWDDIEEATDDDEFLVKLRTALIADDVSVLNELLKGKSMFCPERKNGLSSIKIEDLSLYHNVMMVRDRIWAPSSIILNFFNNFHLGHRGVDIMMHLAQRSVYWSGMRQDITDYFNECQTCNRHMDNNKKLEDLPEDETIMIYECISMDGFQTPTGEHGLAIVDRHSGYIWCEKSGDQATGTADKMYEILLR